MADKVRITPRIATASGQRRGWVKIVSAVDPDGKDRYAIEGELLDGREIDVEVGTVLLSVEPEGTVREWGQSAHVLQVQADGSIVELLRADWRKNFLTVRDTLIELLAKPEHEAELKAQAKAEAEPLVIPPLLAGALFEGPAMDVVQVEKMAPQRFIELTTGSPVGDLQPWDPTPERILSWQYWPQMWVDPVSRQVHAHDGAHRIAAAALAGVPTVEIIICRVPDPRRADLADVAGQDVAPAGFPRFLPRLYFPRTGEPVELEPEIICTFDRAELIPDRIWGSPSQEAAIDALRKTTGRPEKTEVVVQGNIIRIALYPQEIPVGPRTKRRQALLDGLRQRIVENAAGMFA
jgi:hypothetical protein